MDTQKPLAPSLLTTVELEVSSADELDPLRLQRAKSAYTTRFVAERIAIDPHGYRLVSGDDVVPRAGDVVLATVSEIGQHPRIERPDSRRSVLFEGDEILVAYGARYAPDQFESEVPGSLDPTNLAAAGGVAGDVIAAHYNMDEPTAISPVGLLADAEGVVTLQRCAPRRLMAPEDLPPIASESHHVVGVLGTSMNSGKTTTVAAIVRGLTAAGFRVAAGKVTGTGAGGDPKLFEDSGTVEVLDFTDFGFASTYGLPHDQVRALLVSILHELAAGAPDAIVVEIADGLFQQETARLIDDPLLVECLNQVVFSAGDAMGAMAGVEVLVGKGMPPVCVSGLLTASPLALREAETALEVPVLSVDDLADADCARLLMTRTHRDGETHKSDHGCPARFTV